MITFSNICNSLKQLHHSIQKNGQCNSCRIIIRIYHHIRITWVMCTVLISTDLHTLNAHLFNILIKQDF